MNASNDWIPATNMGGFESKTGVFVSANEGRLCGPDGMPTQLPLAPRGDAVAVNPATGQPVLTADKETWHQWRKQCCDELQPCGVGALVAPPGSLPAIKPPVLFTAEERTRCDQAIAAELGRVGRPDLRTDLENRVGLWCNQFVAHVDVPMHERAELGLPFEYTQARVAYFVLSRAVDVLVSPNGPHAEVIRRRQEVADHQRQAAEQKVKDDIARMALEAKHDRQQERVTRWRSLSEAEKIAIRAMRHFGAGSRERQIIAALHAAAVEERKAPHQTEGPELDRELAALVWGLTPALGAAGISGGGTMTIGTKSVV